MTHRVIALRALLIALGTLCSTLAIGQECGMPLGSAYKGVAPLSNSPYMGKGTSCGGDELSPYGYKWQCVEYIKRFHAENTGSNAWNPGGIWPGIGSAYKYFSNASKLGLVAYPNGSSTQPSQDDILVFDRATKIGDTFGHVAIVSDVSDTGITVVEQNSNPSGYKFLPRDSSRSGYYLVDRGSYPILGWLRKGSSGVITDTVTLNRRVWAQPDLFTNLSWNQINAVCPGGTCKSGGVLNDYAVTGWRWASVEDVNALFNSYIGSNLLGPGPDFVVGACDSNWAKNFFADGWRPTSVENSSGKKQYRAQGLMRDPPDSFGYVRAGYMFDTPCGVRDGSSYFVDNAGTGTSTEPNFKLIGGAYFYRQP